VEIDFKSWRLPLFASALLAIAPVDQPPPVMLDVMSVKVSSSTLLLRQTA
jgi:hypothetical protein